MIDENLKAYLKQDILKKIKTLSVEEPKGEIVFSYNMIFRGVELLKMGNLSLAFNFSEDVLEILLSHKYCIDHRLSLVQSNSAYRISIANKPNARTPEAHYNVDFALDKFFEELEINVRKSQEKTNA